MTHLRDMLSNFLGYRLITAETARVAYTQTEGHHPGELPALVAQPVSIEEVRQLVRAAAAQGVPIVGYGAGTSLEGNAAAVTSDTLVVDFSRMNEIVEISPEDLLVVVQPEIGRAHVGTPVTNAHLVCRLL